MASYVPRLMKYHSEAHLAGIRFKVYFISAAQDSDVNVTPALESAAQALAGSSIPAMDHSGLGYIIYHEGEEANWLLTRVWLEGGIISGLLGKMEDNRYIEVTDPLIECVWEEVPAHFERNAWVKHMMSETPDPQNYLGDRLPDGHY